MMRPNIFVFSRDEAELALLGDFKNYFTHAISIVGSEVDGLDWHIRPTDIDKVPSKLLLTFDDASNSLSAIMAGFQPPAESDIQSILNYGKKMGDFLQEDSQADHGLLIHCMAGKSRSTAAAFILLVQKMGVDNVTAAYDALIKCVPIGRKIIPNPLMIEMADKLLGANGKMISELSNRKI